MYVSKFILIENGQCKSQDVCIIICNELYTQFILRDTAELHLNDFL